MMTDQFDLTNKNRWNFNQTHTHTLITPRNAFRMQSFGPGFNTLRPRQDGRHFPDDMFKCIFLNEIVWIPIQISLKFVPKGSINNNPALFQIMAWRRPGDKPLSEPMMVISLTHICVTRPQWVNEWMAWPTHSNFKWIWQHTLPLSFLHWYHRGTTCAFDAMNWPHH